MKILLLTALFPPIQVGGAEKAVECLAEALTRQGNRVVVVSLHPGEDEIVSQEGTMRVYRLPIDNLYWPFGDDKERSRLEKWLWHLRDIWNGKAAQRVAQILDREKPDVVHTHNIVGFSVSIWHEIKKRNIRLVHTMHDYYMLCPRSDMFRKGRSCEQRCLSCKTMTVTSKLMSRRLDALVSVSASVIKRHHAHGYFKNVPASVIYNIEHSIAETQAVCPGYRSSDSRELVFGFIGRLSEEKGIRMLLEAATFLKSANWRLRIAGRGEDSFVSELKAQYSDPRIEWVGYVDSRSFYDTIDLTVVPSVWADPLPYVVVESFAAGKSLICSDSGGLPELASLGAQVKTYPAKDLPSLVNAMEEAIANREIWRTGGFKNGDARKAFAESVVINRYLDVYRGSAHVLSATPEGMSLV